MPAPSTAAPDQNDNEQNVRLGTFMLERDTEHWWGSVKKSWEQSGTELSWGNFLEAFNEKYFPDFVRERKEVDFIELHQGNLSVEQYSAKFAELSRYAPHIMNTEVPKENKFERGLRPEIRWRVISANIKTFPPLIDLAMKIERDCEESLVGGNWKMGPAQFRNLGRKARPPPRKNFRGRDN
ncbi:uncharacterized protein LOC105421945 [Amborella trichopoda]|uniref:uncharacterized protein LOC105421945 n=1 Tax=Amborella trichopoda TaxID=13333 RepID=UPI0005D44FE6|nr:uncharacterized protein LOC105421945 [Amborella trichopoda]|eukprot:XP_011629417.1 uncharacterized protein LOC105421945 [Amborella trichopoda]